jgi:hypothetical protein
MHSPKFFPLLFVLILLLTACTANPSTPQAATAGEQAVTVWAEQQNRRLTILASRAELAGETGTADISLGLEDAQLRGLLIAAEAAVPLSQVDGNWQGGEVTVSEPIAVSAKNLSSGGACDQPFNPELPAFVCFEITNQGLFPYAGTQTWWGAYAADGKYLGIAVNLPPLTLEPGESVVVVGPANVWDDLTQAGARWLALNLTGEAQFALFKFALP